MLKERTIDMMIENLNKTKKREEDYKMNEGRTFKIVNIPILIRIEQNGNIGEITFPEQRIIFESENC